MPGRRWNNGGIHVQRGQNGGKGRLPGAQVPLHSERLLSMQRQIMRETRRGMQQHGKIRIPVFDLVFPIPVPVYLGGKTDSLIRLFLSVWKRFEKGWSIIPVAAACVQLGIQTTQGHRERKHGGEGRGGFGRWDACYHRGLQRLVRERSVRRCLQVGLHRRCLQRKGKRTFFNTKPIDVSSIPTTMQRNICILTLCALSHRSV